MMRVMSVRSKPWFKHPLRRVPKHSTDSGIQQLPDRTTRGQIFHPGDYTRRGKDRVSGRPKLDTLGVLLIKLGICRDPNWLIHPDAKYEYSRCAIPFTLIPTGRADSDVTTRSKSSKSYSGSSRGANSSPASVAPSRSKPVPASSSALSISLTIRSRPVFVSTVAEIRLRQLRAGSAAVFQQRSRRARSGYAKPCRHQFQRCHRSED